MTILKIIGWTALVIIGIYVLFWAAFILLSCIGEAAEMRDRAEHYEKLGYGDKVWRYFYLGETPLDWDKEEEDEE